MKCECTRTGGDESTHKLLEGMVLFTSHNVTVLQCTYNRCSKWMPLPWIHSLAHFSMSTEMGLGLIMLVAHLTMCGKAILEVLAVNVSKCECKCLLSVMEYIGHASC